MRSLTGSGEREVAVAAQDYSLVWQTPIMMTAGQRVKMITGNKGSAGITVRYQTV